jgi:hypothetical protein
VHLPEKSIIFAIQVGHPAECIGGMAEMASAVAGGICGDRPYEYEDHGKWSTVAGSERRSTARQVKKNRILLSVVYPSAGSTARQIQSKRTEFVCPSTICG